MPKKVKEIMPTVKSLIEEDPSLADNNPRLIANLWYQRLKEMGVVETYPDTKSILSFIVSGLPSAESITRASRKLQMDNPELQGKEWKKRQAYSKTYRKNINKIVSEPCKESTNKITMHPDYVALVEDELLEKP